MTSATWESSTVQSATRTAPRPTTSAACTASQGTTPQWARPHAWPVRLPSPTATTALKPYPTPPLFPGRNAPTATLPTTLLPTGPAFPATILPTTARGVNRTGQEGSVVRVATSGTTSTQLTPDATDARPHVRPVPQPRCARFASTPPSTWMSIVAVWPALPTLPAG